jgi:coniferyl-aldehyde dehydrogenase
MNPVLLVDVSDEMAVMNEEIFGPILPVVPVDDMDSAARYVVARPRPLAMYVFERDGAAIEALLQRTHAGGVTVNDTLLHIATEALPFGGVGASGFGAYHGKEGFDSLSHRKAIFEQAPVNAGSLLDPPYGRRAERLADWIVRLQRGVG